MSAEAALLIDRSSRSRTMISGTRAAEAVNGLVTNDVAALTPGHGLYAAALTPKGKIAADVRIFARDGGDFLIDTSASAAIGWQTLLRKYMNPRFAAHRDVTASLADIGVFGARAADVVAGAFGLDANTLRALPPYGQAGGVLGDAAITVARVPDVGPECFECFVPATAIDMVRVALAHHGALAGGDAAWDVARVEAGRPEWGPDMDDNTLPQEANLDTLHAISYTKGCYTGQETVARIHFRGHVNRHLRGLRFDHAAAPSGAQLAGTEGQPAGDVRTVVDSPRFGRIALGMVRREIPVGATLTARWEGGESGATVAALPFTA